MEKIYSLKDLAHKTGRSVRLMQHIASELRDIGAAVKAGRITVITDIDAAAEYVRSGRGKNRAARLAGSYDKKKE